MVKKFSMFSVAVLALSLLVTSPALALTATEKAADVAAKITCVSAAVEVREAALQAAVAKRSASVAAAYTTRANVLKGAYMNTTSAKVQVGTKIAWADFNKTIRLSTATWKASHTAIWSTFKSAVTTCKAPSGVSDASNSTTEVSSQ